ncbi:MAG: CheR family methyltransferase [Treponema sp.]
MTIESILVSDEEVSGPIVAVAEKSAAEQRERDRESQTTIDFKMVTFALSGKDYSIDIMNVKEIAKAGNFTYVPNTLPFVIGVYNLRGEIIPILDMRLFFNISLPASRSSELENLLILNVDEQTFGIVVDKIDKVVGVQKSAVQPPHPLFGDINVKYISGVVENNKRLYILLDVERIFSKETQEAVAHREELPSVSPAAIHVAPVAAPTASAPVAEPEKTAAAEVEKDNKANTFDQDYKFLIEALKNFKNFIVSDINKDWVQKHFEQWVSGNTGKTNQLQSEKDANEFLKPFWSKSTGNWWKADYADAIKAALPDNSAKQIVVWNPGCGNGMETYCLACLLINRYQGAKIKIYAQDVDLLGVSNAAMLTVPESEAGGWLAPFLTKNALGSYVFSPQVKDSIMFEYHDCRHANALPAIDIIFSRDLLSFFDEESLRSVLNDFDEKVKGNGVAIVGDNEKLPNSCGFIEHTEDLITIYKKQ